MGSVPTQLAKLDAAEAEGDVEAFRPEGPRPRSSDSPQSPLPVPQVPLEEFPSLPLGNNAPRSKSRPSPKALGKVESVRPEHHQPIARPKAQRSTSARPPTSVVQVQDLSDSDEGEQFNEAVHGTIYNFCGLNG